MILNLLSYYKSILSILSGCTSRDQVALDILIDKCGYSTPTAWYPNCGLDFRDLIELNTTREGGYTRGDFPGLYIHTDYKPNWSRDADPFQPFSLSRVQYDGPESDAYQTVIQEIYEMTFSEFIDVDYQVSPDFVDFPDHALPSPKIFLLWVIVTSSTLSLRRIPVLYFVMESINFLDEVLLKHQISVTHMVKVREGCGFGGNRKSITLAYAFARVLGFRHLFIDTEAHTDYSLTDQIATKHGIVPTCYDIDHIVILQEWSGYQVNLFNVIDCDSGSKSDVLVTDENHLDQPQLPEFDFFVRLIAKIKAAREEGRSTY